MGMFEWDFVETDIFTITAEAKLPGGDLQMVANPVSSKQSNNNGSVEDLLTGLILLPVQS